MTTKDNLPPVSEETRDLYKQPLPTRRQVLPESGGPVVGEDWYSQVTAALESGRKPDQGVWTAETGTVWESEKQELIDQVKAQRLANMGDHRAWTAKDIAERSK
jgi:hypothetical protein